MQSESTRDARAGTPPGEALVLRVLQALIALGVLARIARFAVNRSLWGDEASLAVNVVERGFVGLFEPLRFAQSAPPGFLALERSALLLLGDAEYALRLVPLAASLASLPLFFSVARRFLGARDAWLALALMATAEPLIQYGAELKQYSLDVFVALGLLRLGLGPRTQTSRVLGRPGASLAAAGALAVWFSHPAIFVCAAIGCGGWLEAQRAGDRVAAGRWLASGALWLASIGVEYALVLRHALAESYLSEYWDGAFAPFPPLSLADLAWYPRTLLGFFNDPLGLPPAPLAALVFVLGSLRLVLRSPAQLGLLLGPVAFALVASALGFFPFQTSLEQGLDARVHPLWGRVLLFAVPLALVVVAAGLGWGLGAGRASLRAASLALALATCALSLRQLVVNLADPPQVHELRPLVEAIAREARPTDLVFVQRRAEPVYEYYARRARLPVAAVQAGSLDADVAERMQQRLDGFEAGRRFWLVSLHHPRWDSALELHGILERMTARAGVVAAHEAKNAQVLLFEVPAGGSAQLPAHQSSDSSAAASSSAPSR